MTGSRCVLTWVTLGESLLVRFSRCICPCSGLQRCGAHDLNRSPGSPVPAWSHKDIPNCCSEQFDAYPHCHTSASIITKAGIINKSKEFWFELRSPLRTRIRCKCFTSCCFDDDNKAIEGLWSCRQVCIGLRAATQQVSNVAHCRKRRQGRAEQVTR